MVRFNNREKKNEIIKAAKRNKLAATNLGFQERVQIFCDEHLTHQNKQILLTAERLRRKGKLAFVWVKEGNIPARETREGKVHRIAKLCN